MTTQESKDYARGYVAGRKRMESDLAADAKYMNQREFLDAAFLAALPACIATGPWKQGETVLNSLEQRTALAWDFAEAGLKQRRYPA